MPLNESRQLKGPAFVYKLSARCYFGLSLINIVHGALNTGDVSYYSIAIINHNLASSLISIFLSFVLF